jgi:hypothetical protein
MLVDNFPRIYYGLKLFLDINILFHFNYTIFEFYRLS